MAVAALLLAFRMPARVDAQAAFQAADLHIRGGVRGLTVGVAEAIRDALRCIR